jgi:hypothetical protein
VEKMTVNGLSIEKIENYDPYNSKSDKNGMVTEWVGRNDWGNAVVFGDTKAECIKEAKRYTYE